MDDYKLNHYFVIERYDNGRRKSNIFVLLEDVQTSKDSK